MNLNLEVGEARIIKEEYLKVYSKVRYFEKKNKVLITVLKRGKSVTVQRIK